MVSEGFCPIAHAGNQRAEDFRKRGNSYNGFVTEKRLHALSQVMYTYLPLTATCRTVLEQFPTELIIMI